MKRLTKKQKKLAKGPNKAVQASIRQGENQGSYKGTVPLFSAIKDMFLGTRFVKTQKGIPFVNTRFWQKMENGDG